MTVLFSPDICLTEDPAGFGQWLIGHAAEHDQMRNILLTQTHPIIIPDYNIRSWSEDPKFVTTWLQTHQFIHDALDTYLNVTATDFSLVDFKDERESFIWMDNHRFTHAAYRQILNIT